MLTLNCKPVRSLVGTFHPGVLLAICALFITNTSMAQLGWKWGAGSILFGSENLEVYGPTVVDKNANVFVAGNLTVATSDSVEFGSHTVYSYGSSPMIVAKADSSGNFLWVLSTRNANACPLSMVADTAGNIYVLGMYWTSSIGIGSFTLLNPAYHTMYFLIKCNPSGGVIWAKNIAFSGGYLHGGLGIDNAGYLYINGDFDASTMTIGSTTLVNNGLDDVFMAKCDNAGNVIWAKNFGGSGSDLQGAFAVSPNGDIYVAGKFLSATMTIGSITLTDSGRYTPYLVKFDSTGTPQWGTVLRLGQWINDIKTDAAANLYMTGYFDSSMVLGPDTLINVGIHNFFIAKFDSSGTVRWAKAGGGNQGDGGSNIAVDYCGNVWISGSMGILSGTIPMAGYSMDFEGHTLYAPLGSYDPMFIAQYDTAGNYQSTMAVQSGGDDASGIAADYYGNIYIGGDYWNTDLIFGNDTLFQQGSNESLFMARYQYNTVGCAPPLSVSPVNKPELEVDIYPNPANFKITIAANASFAFGARVDIYDLTGRMVNSQSLAGSKSEISVSQLSPAVYECRIINDSQIVTKKLVITK